MATSGTNAFVQVVTGILLIAWFGVYISTIMLASDAPGEHPLGQLILCAVIPLYPVIIGILYPVMGWYFLRMPNWIFSPIVILVPLVVVGLTYAPSIWLKSRGVNLTGVSVRGDTVYLNGSPWAGVDAPSFEVLHERFSKDKNHVYMNSSRSVIEGADPKTFYVFEAANYGDYSRDAKNVFLRDKIIPGADPQSFKPLNNRTCPIGSDHSHVFVDYKTSTADPASFAELSENYFKDHQRIYYYDYEGGLIPVPEADLATFQVIDYSWSKDKTHVFTFVSDGKSMKVVVVPEADPATFTPLESDYAKDRAHVYYASTVYSDNMQKRDRQLVTVSGADPATLKVTGIKTIFDKYDATDKDHTWLKGIKYGDVKK